MEQPGHSAERQGSQPPADARLPPRRPLHVVYPDGAGLRASQAGLRCSTGLSVGRVLGHLGPPRPQLAPLLPVAAPAGLAAGVNPVLRPRPEQRAESIAEYLQAVVLLVGAHGHDRVLQCCELLFLGVRFAVLLAEDPTVTIDEHILRDRVDRRSLDILLYEHDDEEDINTMFTVMKAFLASRLSHEGFHFFHAVNAVRWFMSKTGTVFYVRDGASALADREADWPVLEARMGELYWSLTRAGLRGACTFYEEAEIEHAWYRDPFWDAGPAARGAAVPGT